MTKKDDTLKLQLVFDFDGTIANSWPLAKKVYGDISHRYGKPFTPDELEEMRDLSSREFLSALGIPFWKVPFFVYEMRRGVYKRRDELHPILGLEPALQQLQQKGHAMHIVSSNSYQNIDAFLKKNHFDFFATIFAGHSLYKKHTPLLKLKKKFIPHTDQLIYIGDETRDLECANKVGADFIAVTWGGNSRKIFEALQVLHIADTPEELLHIINTHFSKS